MYYQQVKNRTHTHQIKQKKPDQYQTYKVPLSIKHILTFCVNHADIKEKLILSEYLHETLGPDQENINKIIQFLKLFKLYNLI